jgi:hypothetical protein
MLGKIITDYTSVVEALYPSGEPKNQRRLEHDRNIEQLKILDVALNKVDAYHHGFKDKSMTPNESHEAAGRVAAMGGLKNG